MYPNEFRDTFDKINLVSKSSVSFTIYKRREKNKGHISKLICNVVTKTPCNEYQTNLDLGKVFEALPTSIRVTTLHWQAQILFKFVLL